MESMVKPVPKCACPKCRNAKDIVVFESIQNLYALNRDGEIKDFREINHRAIGKCFICDNEFNMYETKSGFIPITPLREILLQNNVIGVEECEEWELTPTTNPMQKEG